MKIKSLQLNSIFDYVRDIRRYSYNIEELLNNKFKTKVNVQQTHPIPDEIEAEIPRFECTMKLDELLVTINISQVRMTINVDFSNKIDDKDDNKISIFDKLSSDIKATISSEVKKFNVLYEGFILRRENITEDINNTVLFKPDSKVSERREKISKDIEDYYILTIEKIFVKGYNAVSSIGALNKNNDACFAGYVEIIIKEINNRKIYNYEKNADNNILNIMDIKEKLLERV